MRTKIIFVAGIGASWGQIPDVKVENAKGETISATTVTERKVPVIMSFWHTTCKPCIMELNAINDVLEDWRKEADFDVVAVSTDDIRSASKAKALASGNGWENFTLLYDKNQELKRAFNVSLIPHVFIFDKEGKMVYSHVGYTPGTEQEYIDKIKELATAVEPLQ